MQRRPYVPQTAWTVEQLDEYDAIMAEALEARLTHGDGDDVRWWEAQAPPAPPPPPPVHDAAVLSSELPRAPFALRFAFR